MKNLFVAGTAKSGLVSCAENDGGSALAHVAKRSHSVSHSFSFLHSTSKRHRFRFPQIQAKAKDKGRRI